MDKKSETDNTEQKLSNGSYIGCLNHYFDNCIETARCRLNRELVDGHYDWLKVQFITGLEKAVTLNLHEDFGVTKQNLIEILDLARKSDLSKREDVDNLYAAYNELNRFNQIKYKN